MSKIFIPPAVNKISDSKAGASSVFLAGTIEMGKSVDWQDVICKELAEYEIDIYNPRRLVSPDDETELTEQINWELNYLYFCKTIFMRLLPGTISPISLLELGLCQGEIDRKKIIVCCEPGYTRFKNVMVTTSHPVWKHPNLVVFTDYQEALKALKSHLSKFKK